MIKFFINKNGNTKTANPEIHQIIFHAFEHSTPKLVSNICRPNNPIAEKPGMKIPIAQKIKVGFKKLYFKFQIFIRNLGMHYS